jgi:CheY-like chemotaxis protein
MDHMMPEMDGVETTAAIRALDRDYAKQMPIIALTANAISGMKEMFLEKGFNDYLAKPIEIPKLDEIMGKWIPQEKRKKGCH